MALRFQYLCIIFGHILCGVNCGVSLQINSEPVSFLTHPCDDDLLKSDVNKVELLSLKLENYNLRIQSELMAMKEQLLREVKTNLELLDSKITTKCNEESKNVISSCTEAMRQENRKYAESGIQSELMSMKEQLLREVKTNLELLDSKITTKFNEESKNVVSSCTEAMRQENRKYAESGIQSELMSMKEQLLREVKTNLELLDSKITTKFNEENKNVVSSCTEAMRQENRKYAESGILSELMAMKEQLLREIKEIKKNQESVPPATKKPASCTEAMRQENGKYAESGVYELYLPEFLHHPFNVYCLRDPDGGEPWAVIQRRQSNDTDFYRGWYEYEHGFGDLNANFFLGLDKIHALTNSRSHDLWFQLEDFENEKRVAKYDNFAIGNAQNKYELIAVGQYSGTAGDSFSYHLGQKFSTKDSDNDKDASNCAVQYTGAWWYKKCHASNLNGLYLGGEFPEDQYAKGVVWYAWRGFYYSLKYVHMAIRPKYH
ncbi:techylectin-5A-like isoform X1 [Bactrocera dorsalis]|uniref:Techylectin-5A-like isoform X1 n=1 Tax=Bactrocera dorsalis TaxID=27457 RepID=A0ABM3IZC2_BACDO|nr:techylectin-5A-like isoform X1 [Bactrocera dorsalis]